jgi:Subtilisin inhibitor-like
VVVTAASRRRRLGDRARFPYQPDVRSLTVRARLLGLALAVMAAANAAHAAGGATSLRIVYRVSAGAHANVSVLRCDPPRGTVPRPAAACRTLAEAGRALFAPTPPGVACPQIYGGPQTAVVTGTLAGRPLWARFTRRDGCEVDRWKRVAFLLP